MLLQYREFYRIKNSQETGKISKESLYRVFISYINILKNKSIYNRLNKNEFDLTGDFNFNEFVSFFWFINNFSQVKLKLKEKACTTKDLIEIANNIVNTLPDKSKRVKLNEKHIQVIFEILDQDSKIFYYN